MQVAAPSIRGRLSRRSILVRYDIALSVEYVFRNTLNEVVPRTRIELVRQLSQPRILSPVRLPIPPPRHTNEVKILNGSGHNSYQPIVREATDIPQLEQFPRAKIGDNANQLRRLSTSQNGWLHITVAPNSIFAD